MSDDRVSWKDILNDWWAGFSENHRLPQGKEVEVFSYLIQTLVDNGYVRSEINRIQTEVFNLCYNKKKMEKGRLFYLQSYWNKAIYEIAGLKISTEIRPGSMVNDVVSQAPLPNTFNYEAEISENQDGGDQKPRKKNQQYIQPDDSGSKIYVEETDTIKEIKEKFDFDFNPDDDIFED